MIGPAARAVSFATAFLTAAATIHGGWALMPSRAFAQAPIPPSPGPAGAAPITPGAATPGAPAPGVPAAPVSAQDEAAGRQHFEKGQELYNKSRFLEAAKEFEAGYRVLPRAAFLLNIGHSYRRAHELRKARSAYETMLRVDPTSTHRALVEDLIRTIDDALIVQTEVPPPVPPRPGLPPASATAAPPAPAPAAAPPVVDLSPPPVALGETAPAEESDSVLSSPWFWGVMGAVLVTAGVGGVLLLRRQNGCRAQTCISAD